MDEYKKLSHILTNKKSLLEHLSIFLQKIPPNSEYHQMILDKVDAKNV